MRAMIRGITACVLVCASSLTTPAGDDDARPPRFSFPGPVAGTEYGRASLVAHIESNDLDAERMVRDIFDGLPLAEMANVLRSRLGAAELAALDAKLDKVNLVQIVAAATSDHELAATLEATKVDERDIRRGLEDVFDDFRPLETAAYWTEHGYNEFFLLLRLRGEDESARRYDDLARYRRRDADKPQDIWETEFRDLPLAERLECYLGLPGRPAQAEVEAFFKKEEAVLTPEIRRILTFGDPTTAARALTRAGLRDDAFFAFFSDLLRGKERSGSGANAAAELLDRLDAREDARTDWLRSRGELVRAVYVGRLTGNAAFPVLGALDESEGVTEGEDKKEKAGEREDLGITASIADYFAPAPDFRLVLYTNHSVRALASGTRYEGLLDTGDKGLKLVAVYGGADRRFESATIHGDGLLLELRLAEARPGRARILLRRTRRY